MSFLVNNSDSDTEDNDSFHSFNESASWEDLSLSLSESECDSAADFESGSEHETSMENAETTVEQPEQLALATGQSPKPTFSGVILKPKSPDFEIHSSDSSACDGISTGKATQVTGRFKMPKKFNISPISQQKPAPVFCCPRQVPPLMSKQVPSKELFSLDQPASVLKEHLTTNRQTEALQKYAFTEIWVGSQQKPSQPKSTRLREFSRALEAYFDKDSSKKSGFNSEPVQKDLEPSKILKAPPKSVKSVEEEYVSPFPSVSVHPAPKVSPLLKGAKEPITVPAGFDLTRLAEIKNPNHWHRRPNMRTGDRIY
ncbi:uncharacterized protein LOC108028302 [Drosophila biarmipes]|uniref:uncharacterized protein LOC108028302 n=1 Tax=Drosophila biarmipes TaxID=125945 RepID=UPI001CDA90B7|nr:uncharacterized protein LOC108028302 [Drosophila biarmipes]